MNKASDRTIYKRKIAALMANMTTEQMKGIYIYALRKSRRAPERTPTENEPKPVTQTREESECTELSAYLAAILPKCSLDTLRGVFSLVSDELPEVMSEREKEIKKIHRLLQLLSLEKLQNLYCMVLYM